MQCLSVYKLKTELSPDKVGQYKYYIANTTLLLLLTTNYYYTIIMVVIKWHPSIFILHNICTGWNRKVCLKLRMNKSFKLKYWLIAHHEFFLFTFHDALCVGLKISYMHITWGYRVMDWLHLSLSLSQTVIIFMNTWWMHLGYKPNNTSNDCRDLTHSSTELEQRKD